MIEAEIKKNFGVGSKRVNGLLIFNKADTQHICIELVTDDSKPTEDYPGIDLATVNHPFIKLSVDSIVDSDCSLKELAGVSVKESGVSTEPMPVLELIFNDLSVS